VTGEPDLTGSRQWRNRSLVRETDEHRLRSLWRTLLGVVIAIAPTAVYLVQQNECVKISYEVSALEEAHELLVKEEQKLRADRTELESLTEIERWASRERGLRQPTSEEVVVVRADPAETPDLLARAPRHANDGVLH
jgi:hypothetical protein